MPEPDLIPMSAPDIGAAEIAAVVRVLRSPHLSRGPALAEFEAKIAQVAGTAYAVGVSSGTAGLHLALVAAGVEPGDEVITSPFSFVASANVIEYCGAKPVFVDVDPGSGNLDPNQLEAAVTPRTKAILPIDVFGQPADFDPIRWIADRHGLAIIEDSCEALGARYRGRPAGSLGDIGVFAFYPNKQITTGEGGCIVTNRADWAELCRALANQGREVGDHWLGHSRLGYNYRLDEMSAALGAAQLDRLNELLANRDRVARWYLDRLAGLAGVQPPQIAATTTRMSWFVFVIRVAGSLDRDSLSAGLAARGIPSRPYFPPIHLQPYYRRRYGLRPGDFPSAEALGAAALALPFSGRHTEQQIDAVCRAIQDLLARESVRA